MPRRYMGIALTIMILVVFNANATDFWLAKDWKQWSKDQCESLLAESPWAHSWRGGGPLGDQLAYAVQLRSSLPAREAMVRKLQLDQKYDKMTGVQRAEFDAKAAQILGRSFDDIILVHVDFSKGLAAPYLQTVLNTFHSGPDTMSASLVTDDGTRITPARVDIEANYAFDLILPRTQDGLLLIKDGQKHFSVQFQSPQVTNPNQSITVPPRLIGVEFDLTKMIVDGKLSY